jgi:tol-pal system protein YbgF
VQQALDNTRQSNTAIAVMQSNFGEAVKRQESNLLTPVANVGAKIDQMSDDFKSVRESVLDMNSRLGKLDAKVSDLQTAINVIKNPPAPPPTLSTPTSTAMPVSTPTATNANAASASGPPAGMQAEATYTNAYRDYMGGSYDLALGEFTEYLKYFGTTQFAPNAQYYVGDIYYKRKDYQAAVQAFDAVLEHFQDNSKTADAHLMKGRSLMALGKRDAAAREYREITTRYPTSEAAPKAKQLLKELGLSAGATGEVPTAKAKPRARRR